MVCPADLLFERCYLCRLQEMEGKWNPLQGPFNLSLFLTSNSYLCRWVRPYLRIAILVELSVWWDEACVLRCGYIIFVATCKG